MNDRAFKNNFLLNNNNNTDSDTDSHMTSVTETLYKDSCDQDFYQIYQFFTMILAQDIIKYCNKESVLRIPIIPPSVVIKLCKSVKTLFEAENIILRLQGHMVIIGDLHGHIMDLFRIIKRFGLPPRTRYLFLGDIVDRGEFSLETIVFIYVMKVLFPNEVFIIRGNHEFEEVCAMSGFLDDISTTYKSKEIFSFFIESFDVMPIAAIINNSILCVHAGIGPNLHSIDDIIEETSDSNPVLDLNNEKQNQYKIKRPIDDFSNDIIASLMWSDPTEKKQENRVPELPSIITPLTGARILTVRPIIENKRVKRRVSNDFNISQFSHALSKNYDTDIENSHNNDLPDLKPLSSITENDIITTNNSNQVDVNNSISKAKNFTTLNNSEAFNYSDGFSPSSRGYGYLFDKRSFDIFMAKSNLALLLRGHQCVHSGISPVFDGRLTTVFSASHYCGSSPNSAGVFQITKYGTRTETFKSLPYLRRSFVVFIPPEREDVFIIPESASSGLTAPNDIAFTSRSRFNSGICKASSTLRINQFNPTNQPNQNRKKASIFSPSSLIATKNNNPLSIANQDEETDPFELNEDENDEDAFQLPQFGAPKVKRHSALAQLSSLGPCKANLAGAGGSVMPGFANDEQEKTSRRFLKLPCITSTSTRKQIYNGDL